MNTKTITINLLHLRIVRKEEKVTILLVLKNSENELEKKTQEDEFKKEIKLELKMSNET